MQLERIVGFDWDDGNASKSEHKHAVSQRESEQVFFNQPLWVIDDPAHSRQEVRAHAFGSTDDERLLHVTFTLRAENTLIRVISARDMSTKERKWYASQNDI
ncbi:MAG: BrnT family toxin [Methylibium sp.]|nr:BrnT family toxin [Methylibium sp.]